MVEPGTIIHGTLLERHLIPAFLDVLREHAPEREAGIVAEFGQTFIDRCIAGLDYSLVGEMDRQVWLIEMLYDNLDEIAPEGHYFGTHEGDGSDFGFWPHPDAP